MEAIKLVPLPFNPSLPAVRVEGDRLVIDRLVVADAAVAAFVADRDPEWIHQMRIGTRRERDQEAGVGDTLHRFEKPLRFDSSRVP
jgi:hypothetical protein